MQTFFSPTQKLASAVVLTLVLLLVEGSALAASVTILCYHRFGPIVADSMTTRTSVFELQLARLRHDGYTFVPLATAIAGLRGTAKLPPKPVVLTVDDGHRTVYSDLLPILRREHLPVTLFVYPSAISNADYAMTWEQLKEVMTVPGVDVQSHTYWHPNFKKEKKRLAPNEYKKLVKMQLRSEE
ncbi:MAG: polysaccharide deacetylase family protein, partial [Desulfobulbaceae bacterium]|nr:polysaccharide deacetylase family protein [Desulfobulbaceae bacterium]